MKNLGKLSILVSMFFLSACSGSEEAFDNAKIPRYSDEEIAENSTNNEPEKVPRFVDSNDDSELHADLNKVPVLPREASKLSRSLLDQLPSERVKGVAIDNNNKGKVTITYQSLSENDFENEEAENYFEYLSSANPVYDAEYSWSDEECKGGYRSAAGVIWCPDQGYVESVKYNDDLPAEGYIEKHGGYHGHEGYLEDLSSNSPNHGVVQGVGGAGVRDGYLSSLSGGVRDGYLTHLSGGVKDGYLDSLTVGVEDGYLDGLTGSVSHDGYLDSLSGGVKDGYLDDLSGGVRDGYLTGLDSGGVKDGYLNSLNEGVNDGYLSDLSGGVRDGYLDDLNSQHAREGIVDKYNRYNGDSFAQPGVSIVTTYPQTEGYITDLNNPSRNEYLVVPYVE